jgi:hypothetical protein
MENAQPRKPAEPSVPNSRKFSNKSTATEAQYDRVDRMFDHAGKQINTLEFRKAGVIHPSGRIKEMNERLGYYIATVALVDMYDDEGYFHPRIAVYELIERPKKPERLQ